MNKRNFYQSKADPRLQLTLAAITFMAFLIIARLFILMIWQHDFYTALAAGSQEVYAQLFPARGSVLIQDSRTGEEFPLAMNRDVFLLYADTRAITSDELAEGVAEQLAQVFQYDDKKKFAVYLQLKKRDDPYEPIELEVEESIVAEIKQRNLAGLGFVRKPKRVYPEGELAASVIGFVGKTDEGQEVGRYGVEGYWQVELSGSGGFFAGARGAGGGWIPLAGRSFQLAEDGANILLTIDRTLQFRACEKLKEKLKEYQAVSASLIIMDPKSGAIRAMCSLPDFDPNEYGKVKSVNLYNNSAIFEPYEPGSVFKPIAMAAALNEGAVTPETHFFDTGSVEAGCAKPIKNAGEKVYKSQTMMGVLENSINTGMVFVVRQLGKNKFSEYVKNFGFGVKAGIELDSEAPGTVESLAKNKRDKLDCYAATGSFGQGISVTPLQLAAAFGAIANGGRLLKPYVVQEVRYGSGKQERAKPTEIRRVLEPRTASLVSSMLVNVVDKGQARHAAVKGYYVAGKTGTAQIPGPGGYTEETNHSFAGFAPIDDPKFVMMVKFEKPERRYADSTAAPTFAEIANFVLQYYQVPPIR